MRKFYKTPVKLLTSKLGSDTISLTRKLVKKNSDKEGEKIMLKKFAPFIATSFIAISMIVSITIVSILAPENLNIFLYAVIFPIIGFHVVTVGYKTIKKNKKEK